jgi:hypothetical protein
VLRRKNRIRIFIHPVIVIFNDAFIAQVEEFGNASGSQKKGPEVSFQPLL